MHSHGNATSLVDVRYFLWPGKHGVPLPEAAIVTVPFATFAGVWLVLMASGVLVGYLRLRRLDLAAG